METRGILGGRDARKTLRIAPNALECEFHLLEKIERLKNVDDAEIIRPLTILAFNNDARSLFTFLLDLFCNTQEKRIVHDVVSLEELHDQRVDQKRE